MPKKQLSTAFSLQSKAGWNVFSSHHRLKKTGAVFCFLELFPFFRCDILITPKPSSSGFFGNSCKPQLLIIVVRRVVCVFFFGVWKSKVYAILEGGLFPCHRNAHKLPFPLHIAILENREDRFPNVTFKTKNSYMFSFFIGVCTSMLLAKLLAFGGHGFPGGMGVSHRNEPVLKLPAMSHRKVAPTGRKTHRC